jgi:hypothetical protein
MTHLLHIVKNRLRYDTVEPLETAESTHDGRLYETVVNGLGGPSLDTGAMEREATSAAGIHETMFAMTELPIKHATAPTSPHSQFSCNTGRTRLPGPPSSSQ